MKPPTCERTVQLSLTVVPAIKSAEKNEARWIARLNLAYALIKPVASTRPDLDRAAPFGLEHVHNPLAALGHLRRPSSDHTATQMSSAKASPARSAITTGSCGSRR
jgi:hypothetical protein